MEIFKATDETYYNQLLYMGPLWLAEFKEFDANYRFAAWTLELMGHFLNMLVNNQFPVYCDEKTLEAFEALLNVEYPYEAALEERRRTVDAFWSGNSKISKSEIIFLVNCYTGYDARAHWNNGTLVIEYDATDITAESAEMLRRILARRMPAHIAFSLVLSSRESIASHSAGAAVAGMEIQLTSATL